MLCYANIVFGHRLYIMMLLFYRLYVMLLYIT